MMKTLSTTLLLAATVWTGTALGQSAKNRPVVPDGERAYATIQVQNLMSKHEYYHAAGMNMEEVDALWVNGKGKFAANATFASPIWVMNGIATIRGAYGEENQRNRQKALEAISKVNPNVKNTPENLGAGHEWVMHTSRTPVIEVAGDGQSAKGIWYSPGMGLMTQIVDGKEVKVQGTFFWEKYGADFVKENGVWKIWHMQMAYDFTPSISSGGNWTDFSKKGGGEAGERPDGPMGQKELPPGFTKPKYSYPLYSPERPGIIYPKIPEPYYTFSETFSY